MSKKKGGPDPSVAVGDIFTNKKGSRAIVEKYSGYDCVRIRFLDFNFHTTIVQAAVLKRGNFKNVYFPSVCGVGFLGYGRHQTSVDGVKTPEYSAWHSMLNRVYVRTKHSIPYIGCSVDPEWHNFQVFAEWFKEQQVEGFEPHLDKDILSKNNKLYGPRTSCLVPKEVNTCIALKANKGLAPGMRAYPNGRFGARIHSEGLLKDLGTYSTMEEAFAVYKPHKEGNVKRIADKFKHLLRADVYKALYDWEVLITD